MSSWRDISTAPKDGTLVLFHSPKGGCFIAPSLIGAKAEGARKANVAIYKATGEWPNAGWNPTHWQPLPESPAEHVPSPYPDLTREEGNQ